MNSYKELNVYQKSLDLSIKIYKVTRKFPKEELFGLTSQIRRACVAIPSNIAEGQSRGHKKEYIQFLRIAFGSGSELETQLLIAFKIDYLEREEYIFLNNNLTEIMKMLNKLISVLSK